MPEASLAQLAEHALRKRTVVGSIPTGGYMLHLVLCCCDVMACSIRQARPGELACGLISHAPTRVR